VGIMEGLTDARKQHRVKRRYKGNIY
jgi:hypothetical protein